MARGSQTATDAATSSLSHANALFGGLEPGLMSQAVAPSGMSPADLAAADTAAQESFGGSQAGATGQGALLASRTRNAGTADAAIAESTREAGRGVAREGVQTRLKNAALKREQQESAQRELGSLYGTTLEQVAPNVNANTNAVNASWDWAKDLFGPIVGAAGNAAGSIAKAFGG